MCNALTQLRRWRPEPCCFPTSTFWSLRPVNFHVTETACHVCCWWKFTDVSFATSLVVKDGDLFLCFCVYLLTTMAQPARCVWKPARAASQGPSVTLPPFLASTSLQQNSNMQQLVIFVQVGQVFRFFRRFCYDVSLFVFVSLQGGCPSLSLGRLNLF